MARVSTYLNFDGNAEEALEFYRAVFGTDYEAPIMRMGDVPLMPGQDPLPEHERNRVMHASVPTLDGHLIMATDVLESMGHELRIGNNTTIQLEPDSREEAERIYAALAEGGSDVSGLNEMFWGALWGTCLDRFGIRWMVNFPLPEPG